MSQTESLTDTAKAVKKWKDKRGALIMALHEIQGIHGYVPWEAAQVVSQELDIPLARIYEVLTFYNYFKLEAPGKVIISVCAGTACHIKGSGKVLEEFKKELKVEEGQTTEDRNFHLQVVRCLGCCGLAPAVVMNGKTYGKVTPDHVRNMLAEWRAKLAQAAE